MYISKHSDFYKQHYEPYFKIYLGRGYVTENKLLTMNGMSWMLPLLLELLS